MNWRHRTRGSWRVHVLFSTLLLLVATSTVFAEANTEDWPQFRGVDRNGISPATGLNLEWPEAGPKELWRRPLGEGFSAISVVGDRLFTMYAAMEGEKAMEFAAAFDANSGDELWRTAIGEKLDTEFGNGPRSTPLVDGDHVFVLGSRGDLAALSAAKGEVVWKQKITETFESQQPYWGFSTSALLEGDTLILEGGGGDGKSYGGLDKKTGKLLWSSGQGRPGYNSALPVEIHGQRQLVYIAGGQIRAINPAGEEIWTHAWPEGETHAMPVFIAPDKIFASGVEQVGAALMQVTRNEEAWTVEELWRDRVMRNHFSSSLLHEGHIYGFDNATLKCIDPISKEQKWAKRGFGKGSLIYADGHLLVLSDRGKLILVEATTEKYVQKGQIQALEGRTWTAPVLSKGRLYLRDQTQMVSYDLANAD